MESSQRAFIITDKQSYLEPYDNAAENWKIDFNELYQQMEGKPTQQDKLKEIEETIEHWIATSGEPTIQLKKDNNVEALNDFLE